MSRYAKAITAGVLALKLWATLVMGVDSPGGEAITVAEWFALADVIVAIFGVWGIPNTPPAGETADPNVSETDSVRPPDLVDADGLGG